MTGPGIAPTATQIRVLAALHNHSTAIAELLARAATFDGAAPHAWMVSYHHHALARADLTDAATAGGIPQAWIDHVQARGDRGAAWNPNSPLPDPGPTDWDRILTNLTADVARIQEWEALDAAYHQLAHPNGEAAPTELRTQLEAVRARTAGVANLLGLTTDLAAELWGNLSDWARYAAATLDDVPAEQIGHRWHAATKTDTRAYTGQAAALAADSAIPVDAAAALPPAEELRAAITAELGNIQAQFVSAGSSISAAVDAATTPPPNPVAETVFSASPGVDQPWTTSPANSEAAPIFSSIDGADW
ncbi:hypothetical protein IU510_21055 [Nocardia cyriacigeorgica]|uniref:hypothetical protein n=1 Tax=Nocardia TaxID=1817 RepID=UPI0018931487|nr:MULTISPECIES: hypothetical protein [Nocardia]MBF6100550.1 hypothetical protein [Nocardia cyriacigeorgica]